MDAFIGLSAVGAEWRVNSVRSTVLREAHLIVDEHFGGRTIEKERMT